MTTPTTPISPSRFSKLGSSSTLGASSAGRPSALKSSGFGSLGKGSILQKQSTVSLAGGSGSRPYLYRGAIGNNLGTTYFLEKQAIIIDFGHAFTKVGFATESRPRHIIPTPELRVRHRSGPEVSCTASVQEWTDILDLLMGKIFFHYLSVSPKDRRVVICDAAHASGPFRSALACVMFKRFSIPSVAYVTDLVLPLYLTGLNSGVVIDFGYTSTRIMATLHGIPILSAYGVTACAGSLVNSRLQRGLKQILGESSDSRDLSWLDDENKIEDLKATTCYVSYNASTGKDSWKLHTDQATAFAQCDGKVAKVSERVRWEAAECLFVQPAEDAEGADNADDSYCEGAAPCRGGDGGGSGGATNLPIPDLFVEVLQKCPIDVRPIVLQNIVVCGGCAMMRGLLPRLAIELREKLLQNQDTNKLAERLRFTPLDFSPVCAVWTGGAVFGSLEGTNDYTSEMWERGDPIPDWCKDGFV